MRVVGEVNVGQILQIVTLIMTIGSMGFYIAVWGGRMENRVDAIETLLEKQQIDLRREIGSVEARQQIVNHDLVLSLRRIEDWIRSDPNRRPAVP